MESENTNTTTTTTTASWSSSTNWTIAGGSLVNSVTFESYLSTIIDDEEEEEEENSIANSTTHNKSPLILRPPAPDSSPCEIKSMFYKKFQFSLFFFFLSRNIFRDNFFPRNECEFSGKIINS
jgi:hypothetical protein